MLKATLAQTELRKLNRPITLRKASKVRERWPRVALTILAALFALSAVFIEPIADKSPMVGAFVTSTFTEPSSWFVLLIALFFILRQFWQVKPAMGGDGNPSSQVESIIKSLAGQAESALKSQSSMNDALTQRATALEKSLKDANKLADENKHGLTAALATIGELQKFTIKGMEEQRERSAQALKEQRDFQAKMEAWVGQLRDEVERRFEWLDQAFTAIHYREWHHRLLNELEEEFYVLDKPVKDGFGIPNWQEWDAAEKSWRGKLDQWLTIVDAYAMGAAEEVRAIPDELYYGTWTIDQGAFVNPDHLRRYKELAILWRNVGQVRERVERCLVSAAFHSPSMKGRIPTPRCRSGGCERL